VLPLAAFHSDQRRPRRSSRRRTRLQATAIIAINDLLAFGVIRRLSDREVDVPGRISVVGYDDIFGANFSNPALTTLGGLPTQAGRAAVDLVLRMVREPGRSVAGTRLVVPSQLIIRGTSGPLRDST
jgi:LacI family transcriptional regulator